MLKTSGFALGFQHLPRDIVNVTEWKIMFDPYIKECAWTGIEPVNVWLPDGHASDRASGPSYLPIESPKVQNFISQERFSITGAKTKLIYPTEKMNKQTSQLTQIFKISKYCF